MQLADSCSNTKTIIHFQHYDYMIKKRRQQHGWYSYQTQAQVSIYVRVRNNYYIYVHVDFRSQPDLHAFQCSYIKPLGTSKKLTNPTVLIFLNC